MHQDQIQALKQTVPHAVTSLSLGCGWLALVTISADIRVSVGLALAAFALDSLDGHMARFLGVTSQFGRNLDSLADTILYLVWPALVYYLVFGMSSMFELGVIWTFLFTGILRLARFNTIGYVSNKYLTGYPGLPVVFSHVIVIGWLVLGKIAQPPTWLLSSLVLTQSWLMIQSFPFPRISTALLISILAVAAGVVFFWV